MKRSSSVAVGLVALGWLLLGDRQASAVVLPSSANLQLWLDAGTGITESDGRVSQWGDRSGLGNDLTQADGARQPLYVASAINGLPALQFNTGGRSNDAMISTTAFLDTRYHSVFAVVKPSQDIVNRDIVSTGGTGSGTLLLGRYGGHARAHYHDGGGLKRANATASSSDLNPSLSYQEVNDTHVVSRWNGGAAAETTVAAYGSRPTATRLVRLASRDDGHGHHWRGDIAEVIIYDVALSAADRVFVENYLSGKYAFSTAGSQVWDGGGANDNISTAANWNPDAAFVSGNQMVFTGSARTTPNVDAPTAVAGIAFQSQADQFILGGSALTVGANSITNWSTNNQTINNALVLGTDQTWHTVGDLTVAGNVSGNYGITKTGAGTLTLSGSNSFSGILAVAEGTLSINAWNTDNANGPLGKSNTKVVLGGEGTVGTLEYTGGIIGSGQSLRGVEVASGGHGTVHLLFSNTGTTFPTDETYRNRYIHIDGNRIGGSGGLTIDTRSPNGEHGSRFIITNPGGTTFSGSLTVASNSEVQFSAPSDSPFTFGSSTVTVDAGGILNLWRNGAATVTLGGLAGDGLVRGDGSGLKTYRIGSNNDSTAFSGVIANGRGGATVALTKIGEGVLTLSGSSTYTGGTRVEQGVLALGGTNRLATSGAITVDGGTLDLGSYSQTTSGDVTFLSGAVTNGTLAKSGANYNAQGGAVSAILAGSVGLDKTGTGTLILSGQNSFNGQVAIAAGVLSIDAWNINGNNGPLGNSNTKVVLGGDGTTGTLQYTGGNLSSSTWRGIQVDDGRTGILHLAFDGTDQSRYIHIPASQLDIRGSLTVDARDGTTIPDGDTLRRRMIVTSPDSASLVFTGQLTVAQHTELQLSAPVATPFNFGSGTITVNEGGILNLYATATGGADATVTLGGLAGEGVVRGDAGGLKTYRVGSNHLDTEFSGAIIDGRSGATVALTKVGDGVLTLWGSNTYTQATNVEKGTLLVNGSLTGTSGVTVHDGATLGGIGSIAAPVAGEGWISPGNSAGILTVQSIDPSDGLNASFEFGKTESPNYSDAANSINDVLRITGANPITGPLTADNMIDVYFGIAPNLGDVFRGGVYVDVAGDPQGLTDFYDAVAGAKYNYYVHDGGGYVSLNDYASWLDVAVSTVAESAAFFGGTVEGGVMQFTVIPEPGTWLMLLAAGAAGLLMRRRRK